MDAAQGATFAELVRHHRLSAGLSQQALAERAGVSVDAISVLERGRRGAPRPDTVHLLADALELDPAARRAFVDAALALRTRASPPPAATTIPAPARPAALPRLLTSLVGREREVAAVIHHLRHHQGRLLTLTGPGGIGKTRLALAVAAAVQPDFADGVAFIPLAEIGDYALVEPVVAQALGLRQTGGQSVREVLTEHLAAKQFLLALDNFEHVLAAASLLTQLLSVCPHLTVLVTSQAALRMQAEQLFPVTSLSFPPPAATVESMLVYPAIQLFAERARAVDPGFTLSPFNAAVVAGICRRLDGLPLAIELVAARVQLFSPAALLARLEHRLALATGGSRDLPARHQALRATLDWSVALLPAEDRILFARLAVFAGGATLEAIETICTLEEGRDVLGSVASLIQQSLVSRQSLSAEAEHAIDGADGERYTMLQTIREYAEELLVASAESAALCQRHAAYFLDLAVETWTRADSVQRRQVARLTVEQDNLRTALTWLLAHDGAGALRLAAAMGRFWRDGGYYAEGRQHLAAALARAGGEHAARVHAMYWAAELAYAQGDVAAALRLAEDALHMAREHGDDQLLAHALREVGLRRYEAGELALGRELLAESLRHARHANDVETLAGTLCAHAAVRLAEGDAAVARPFIEEGLSLYRDLGDDLAVAYALELQGRMLLMSEDDEFARASLRESLVIRRMAGNKAQVAACLELLAALLLRPGYGMDGERALQLLGAAEALRTQSGAPVPPIERVFYERTMDRARALLGAADAGAAWARGQALTIDEAGDLALTAIS